MILLPPRSTPTYTRFPYTTRYMSLWRLQTLAGDVVRRMKPFDFVLGPTVPITPPRVDEVATAETYQSANMLALRNTCIANLLGFCGLTLPAGLDAAGMPVGLQLMAPPEQEELLLAAGLACEREIGRAHV